MSSCEQAPCLLCFGVYARSRGAWASHIDTAKQDVISCPCLLSGYCIITRYCLLNFGIAGSSINRTLGEDTTIEQVVEKAIFKVLLLYRFLY